MDGILIINKPVGPTSHDIISAVRKKLDIKKVGHAGTLDPMACGVLVVLVGKATKLSSIFLSSDKTYIAVIRLGILTDTLDLAGKVKSVTDVPELTEKRIDDVLAVFEGEILQVPPMYSAKKVKGRKLYEMARKGIEVERKPEKVIIHEIKRLKYMKPDLTVRISCSKGTYIRSLADDIGKVFGCNACIAELQRVKSGKFSVSDAIPFEELKSMSKTEIEKSKCFFGRDNENFKNIGKS
ncbi:MAG: tRNA pseudouridine(55) synthase TruB [Candidatus Aureabacteria bacterium]|nr:tRNA pseudouridine(55) synthase TruB [Candidatus Auribacterota bacterium]